MVLTENFKTWFNESIMHSNGEPVVFYHKSRAKEVFNEFKLEGEGVVKNPYNNDYGFFFVHKEDKRWIDYIGDGIDVYCHLRMEKPFVILDDGEGNIVDQNEKVYEALYITKELVDLVRENSHDGIMIVNRKHYSQYVVFHPNQIKSIDNNGNYSLTSNNIFE